MHKIAVLGLLFLFGQVLFAQQAVHLVIGAQDLANVDIYSLHQGSDEILYAATDHGLFAYKHGAFSLIPGPITQHGSSLFNLQRDQKGRLFCNNLSGQIFLLENDSLKLFFEAEPNMLASQFSFAFDARNDLYIGSKILGKVPVGSEKVQVIRSFSSENAICWLSKMPNGALAAIYPNQDTLWLLNKSAITAVEIPVSTKADNTAIASYPYYLEGKLLVINMTGDVWADNSQVSMAPKQSKTRERMAQFDAQEIYGLDFSKGGRVLGLEKDVLTEKECFFPDKFLSAMTVGQRGNLFFGTFGEGILMIPNRAAKRISITAAQGQLRGICAAENGNVFITTRAGEIFHFKNQLERIYMKQGFSLGRIYHFEGIDFKHLDRFPGLLVDSDYNIGTIKNARQQVDGSVLIATSLGIYRFGKTSPQDTLWMETGFGFQYLRDIRERCYAAIYGPNAVKLYVATATKLYEIDQDGNLGELKLEGRSLSCNDLLQDGNRIIAATQNNGIVFFENGLLVKQVDQHNGLGDNFVTKLVKHGNKLFVAHQKGVQAIDLETEQVQSFGLAEGVPSGTVRDLAVSQNRLLLLMDNDFVTIDLAEKALKKYPLDLVIDSIVVANFGKIQKTNGKFSAEKTLRYDENRIEFFIDFRLIEAMEEAQLAYQLENFEENWQTTSAKAGSIVYKSLPSGAYKLKLKVRWREQESETFEFQFQILPPYWRQWWFFILCAITLVLVVAFGFILRIRQIRKGNQRESDRQALEKNLIESKLKALRSQMNPHFIFNSLNSIQDLILRQDTDLAYDYVVLFADLVRSTLRYSEQEYISMADEIDFLNTYLSLEALRFKEAFSYSLAYDELEDIEIPSMVIQPFIENALQHGLLHKDGLRTLKVEFDLGEMLVCTITDNGIGRAAAETIQKRQGGRHESFSLSAIQKRLEILEELQNTKVGYVIEDLYDGVLAAGTRVTIRLAFKRKF